MTTIAILIILIVIQLLLNWLMPVEAKRMVVTPATKVAVCWSVDWAPYGFMSASRSTTSRQILGLRYGGSYDYSLSYSYRQPVAVAKVMVQSPFYIEEEDEQEQYEKNRPVSKAVLFKKQESFVRKEKALRDLRRGQRAIKALMRV